MRARLGTTLALLLVTAAAPACKGGGRSNSPERWLDKPSTAANEGTVWEWSDLGARFELPDALYVFKSCAEPAHTQESETGWVPVFRCDSSSNGGGDEYADDAVEELNWTIYATRKTRPLDERTVAWFDSQYKAAGLQVVDLSYNSAYQRKSGIFARLHVVGSDGVPRREIVRFMFAKGELLFVAQMEYPFGDTRSVERDWNFLLWSFDTNPELHAQQRALAQGE